MFSCKDNRFWMWPRNNIEIYVHLILLLWMEIFRWLIYVFYCLNNLYLHFQFATENNDFEIVIVFIALGVTTFQGLCYNLKLFISHLLNLRIIIEAISITSKVREIKKTQKNPGTSTIYGNNQFGNSTYLFKYSRFFLLLAAIFVFVSKTQTVVQT